MPRPLTDPHSGQPGFKSTPARLAKVATEWRGFLIAADTEVQPDCLWSTRISVPGGVLHELAGIGDPAMLDACLPRGDRIEAYDRAQGSRRVAILSGGRLAAVLFVTKSGILPSRDWLIAQLAEAAAAPTILAGRAPGVQEDRGAIICVCFDIGMRTIVSAIASQGLADVASIGKALGAGTNCGSCRPALAQLLASTKDPVHAAS